MFRKEAVGVVAHSVNGGPGFRKGVAMSAHLAAVVVTDLVSSTKLRADLGEEAADQFHRMHSRRLRAVAEANGGAVVKGLGDGVLARFGGAANALAAAVAMQHVAARESRRAG